ncbi:MAG: prepilin-type N-terminal cleavage/methylation domain-containing protein [Pirellulales bacterium]|nr:prepilin-type N-terminal cleavage/methylation domain-containing protein [Pirellulales bacterium]
MAGRRGMTLLEVLLVLGLLAIVACTVWISMDRPIATQRLREAADVVRVAWGRARVKSMTSNQTYVFRYERQGNRYTLAPHQGIEFAPEQRPEELTGQVEAAPADEPLVASQAKMLPDKITFAGGQCQFDQRAVFLMDEVDTLAEGFGAEDSPAASGEAGWSEPIFFYPDGTSTTAELTLENQHGSRITLSLRGMTGVVTISDLHSAEEVLP